MKKYIAALACAASLSFAFPVLADPSGLYDVIGQNPDGTTYAATVLLSRVGETFAVTYTMPDGSRVMGTAIGDDEFLSIGYGSEGDVGVMLMGRSGEVWEGVWTYLGASELGLEEWSPR